PEDFSGAFEDCGIGEFAAGDLVLAEAKRAQFVDQLKEWRANNARIVIYFQTEGEIERFREIMAGAIEGVDFVEGTLRHGFCFPAANIVVLSAAELFGRFAVHARRHLRRAERNRAKRTAAAGSVDHAGKMLAIQAERQMHPGSAFAPDTKWQAEFEHSFPFRETPDQMKAIIDTKIDMERPRPMDRLICGDVGFGKTEVAVSAAFKAVMDGRQVAVLVPTTVLAQQHFEVFRQRMLDYPVRIEMLSRFRSQSEQRKILELLRQGGVDIVIGTHRLISGYVVFKNL